MNTNCEGNRETQSPIVKLDRVKNFLQKAMEGYSENEQFTTAAQTLLNEANQLSAKPSVAAGEIDSIYSRAMDLILAQDDRHSKVA